MNDDRGSEANSVPTIASVEGVVGSERDSLRLVMHGAPVVLTPRETEVIAAVVLEGGQKPAARVLGLSPRTVRWYVKYAMDRARVSGARIVNLTDLLMVIGWLRVPAR